MAPFFSRSEIAGVLAAQGLEHFGFVDTAGLGETDIRSLERRYARWIDRGNQGEMKYLASHAEMKYRPERLLSPVKTLILVMLPYGLPSAGAAAGRHASQEGTGGSFGRVAMYAFGRDYHKVLKKRLVNAARQLHAGKGETDWRVFVDSSPLDERFFAAAAGLGRVGRNGLLIHPRFGSYHFVGEILTELRLDEEGAGVDPSAAEPGAACPKGCRACVKSCPTGALNEGGALEARRCISYLTIEYSGAIPLDLRPLVGEHFFGCDLCQSSCPLNRRIGETQVDDFLTPRAGERVDLEEVLSIENRESMVKRFAGSPVLRLSLSQMRRNAMLVAANAGARELIKLIEAYRESDDPVVAEQARWSLSRLGAASSV
ncbi:MAG TPA: tRNA epoxyqueuosine(34) reductase QueG [Sediminispirochaeta sp.]|nr:tRNA epoxyqueuosine(34) reductase QueG [Sediminispirochaeta sp.]